MYRQIFQNRHIFIIFSEYLSIYHDWNVRLWFYFSKNSKSSSIEFVQNLFFCVLRLFKHKWIIFEVYQCKCVICLMSNRCNISFDSNILGFRAHVNLEFFDDKFFLKSINTIERLNFDEMFQIWTKQVRILYIGF